MQTSCSWCTIPKSPVWTPECPSSWPESSWTSPPQTCRSPRHSSSGAQLLHLPNIWHLEGKIGCSVISHHIKQHKCLQLHCNGHQGIAVNGTNHMLNPNEPNSYKIECPRWISGWDSQPKSPLSTPKIRMIAKLLPDSVKLRWEWDDTQVLSWFCINTMSCQVRVCFATVCMLCEQYLCLKFFAVQIWATARPVAMLPCAHRSADSLQHTNPDSQWEASISHLSTNCGQTLAVGFGCGRDYQTGHCDYCDQLYPTFSLNPEFPFGAF